MKLTDTFSHSWLNLIHCISLNIIGYINVRFSWLCNPVPVHFITTCAGILRASALQMNVLLPACVLSNAYFGNFIYVHFLFVGFHV